MMSSNELRWIELQFYFILYDIWHLHKDFKDILAFARCVKIFNNDIDESKICSLAQDALLQGRFRLNADEFIILCWLNKVPEKAMNKYKRVWRQQIGRLIQHYVKHPEEFYFYPKNPKEDLNQMKLFIDTVERIRGVGITWTTKFTKNFGHYSNRLELTL